jgi:lipopolysaccharide assembly protein A
MRLMAWAAYAALFVMLFGLALNNQHEAVVKGFFGAEWRAPMIVIVLMGFCAGALLTLAAMLPAKLRRKPPLATVEPPAAAPPASPATAAAPPATMPSTLDGHPPRDGL